MEKTFDIGDTICTELDNGMKVKSFVFASKYYENIKFRGGFTELTLISKQRFNDADEYMVTRFVMQERCRLTRMILIEKKHFLWKMKIYNKEKMEKIFSGEN